MKEKSIRRLIIDRGSNIDCLKRRMVHHGLGKLDDCISYRVASRILMAIKKTEPSGHTYGEMNI